MATRKKTTTKAAKQASKKNGAVAKRTSKATASKAKDDLCTFAIRIPVAERDALHKAAGPGKATRFVRAIVAAFANEDEAAFRTALKEARQTRN